MMKPDSALWLWQEVNEPPASPALLPEFREALKAYALSYLDASDEAADVFINEFLKLVLDERTRYISSWLGKPLAELTALAVTTFRLNVLLPYRLRNAAVGCDAYQSARGVRDCAERRIVRSPRSVNDDNSALMVSADSTAAPDVMLAAQPPDITVQRRLDAIRLWSRCWNECYPAELERLTRDQAVAAMLCWWSENGEQLMSLSALAELLCINGGGRGAARLLLKAQLCRREHRESDLPISADSALMAVLKRQIESFFKKS